jgi:UDP:flavonoid glycosyltransferase YjiC (YdhE family)
VKFVQACYGSRGDVEPSVALGAELLRRGHEVRMAVTPDLVGFAEAAGLAAVAFGPDLRSFIDANRSVLMGNVFWKIPDLIRSTRESRALLTETWRQTSTTLTPLVDGADLLITHQYLEESAINIAEYYGIRLATLHISPRRANGQRVPAPLLPLIRSATTVNEWRHYRGIVKKPDAAQRRELGLPKATSPSRRRITERGSLEIQAYDEVCFPGLAAEWAKFDGQRPFVGTLTLALPTDADDAVASWIAAGTPPIYFGFGGTPVESPADTIAMIAAACEQLGERALVCAAASDFSNVPQFEHVKVVNAMNFEAIFPTCRALVHQGGSSTTPIGLRAGVPTLVLWTWPDQSLWGTQLKRLGVGAARSISTTTEKSLVADLREILAPDYAARARQLSTRLTRPAESVANAADLLEKFARLERFD